MADNAQMIIDLDRKRMQAMAQKGCRDSERPYR